MLEADWTLLCIQLFLLFSEAARVILVRALEDDQRLGHFALLTDDGAQALIADSVSLYYTAAFTPTHILSIPLVRLDQVSSGLEEE